MRQEDINKLNEALIEAKSKIHEVICYMCLTARAQMTVMVITEDTLEGAPEDGSRVIILGVCQTCSTDPDMGTKAKNVMAETSLDLSKNLFGAEVVIQ